MKQKAVEQSLATILISGLHSPHCVYAGGREKLWCACNWFLIYLIKKLYFSLCTLCAAIFSSTVKWKVLVHINGEAFKSGLIISFQNNLGFQGFSVDKVATLFSSETPEKFCRQFNLVGWVCNERIFLFRSSYSTFGFWLNTLLYNTGKYFWNLQGCLFVVDEDPRVGSLPVALKVFFRASSADFLTTKAPFLFL